MEKPNAMQIGPWKGHLQMFEAASSFLNAHPVFGGFPIAWFPHPQMAPCQPPLPLEIAM